MAGHCLQVDRSLSSIESRGQVTIVELQTTPNTEVDTARNKANEDINGGVNPAAGFPSGTFPIDLLLNSIVDAQDTPDIKLAAIIDQAGLAIGAQRRRTTSTLQGI